jgi:hypothetical protein
VTSDDDLPTDSARLGQAASFVARWDLDKTYLRTEFDTLGDLLRTAFERPDEKRTVPGAASLLRELSAAGGQIHILSGSPQQMRARIVEKLRLDGARYESLTLKPNLQNVLRLRLRALRDQLGYKLPALLRSRVALAALGGEALPEVLLGDDAEADAFVYSLYADICAGQVSDQTLDAVMRRGNSYDDVIAEALRDARVVPKQPVVRRILIHLERQSRPATFAPYGPRVVPFYNYLQAALILSEDGYLPPAGVVRVATEMVIEHRFDADGLARSYLELRRRGCVRGDLGPGLRAATSRITAEAKLPALRVIESMCDLLDAGLPGIDAPAQPAQPTLDYLALVERHNPRHKSKRRGPLQS